jgi:hypothetical protein
MLNVFGETGKYSLQKEPPLSPNPVCYFILFDFTSPRLFKWIKSNKQFLSMPFCILHPDKPISIELAEIQIKLGKADPYHWWHWVCPARKTDDIKKKNRLLKSVLEKATY